MGSCLSDLKEERKYETEETKNMKKNMIRGGYIEDIEEKTKKNIISTLKKEDNQQINELEIGNYYKKYSYELNKNLPIYVIFNPDYNFEIVNCYDNFVNAKNHWKKILDLLKNTVKVNKNEPIIFIENNYETFREKIDEIKTEIKNDTETKLINNHKIKYFLSETHVNFYEKNIKPYNLYKKLKIKYDFYYVPLSIYNAIETQINIIKTVQILELLGCNKIDIKTNSTMKNETNNIGTINTGIIDTKINFIKNNEDISKTTRDTSYEFLARIFSNEDELLSYINYQCHIFMDENDYNSDIELRYLIRARLKSYLQSYSRTFYVKKLSSIEIKIQTKMNKLYEDFGLDFKYNNESFEETTLIIDSSFFNLDCISSVNNIPINSIGFRIICNRFLKNNNFFNEKDDKFLLEKTRFYEKYLKKKYEDLIKTNSYDISFMKYHYELTRNNKNYKDLINSIESYNDIVHNYQIIRYNYNFTPVNENGYEKMIYNSLYKIINSELCEDSKDIINEYNLGFLKRYLKLNHFDIDLISYSKENELDLIKIKDFEDLINISYKIITDTKNIPLTNKHLPEIIKLNLIKNDKNQIKILFERIIVNKSNKDINQTFLDEFLNLYIDYFFEEDEEFSLNFSIEILNNDFNQFKKNKTEAFMKKLIASIILIYKDLKSKSNTIIYLKNF